MSGYVSGKFSSSASGIEKAKIDLMKRLVDGTEELLRVTRDTGSIPPSTLEASPFFARLESETTPGLVDIIDDYSGGEELFSFTIPAGRVVDINFIKVSFFGTGGVEGGDYGDIPALTNGFVIRYYDDQDNIVFESAFPFRTTNELHTGFTGVSYNDYAGADYLVEATFDFFRIGVSLSLPPGYKVSFVARDNFTALDGQQCAIAGVSRPFNPSTFSASTVHSGPGN